MDAYQLMNAYLPLYSLGRVIGESYGKKSLGRKSHSDHWGFSTVGLLIGEVMC
jgi:hypothetical protein